MLDFVKIRTASKITGRKGSEESHVTVYPEFIVGGSSEDLMIRGGRFYAVWDEDAGYWTQNPARVVDMVDELLTEKARECGLEDQVDIRFLRDFSSKKWSEFNAYCDSLPDNYVELDAEVTYKSQEVTKADYVSKRLPYDLSADPPKAYLELASTIYDPEELQKLEWAVGSVLAGDGPSIQKFLVLYGSSGTGKSTFLNIVMKLFEGYYNVFEAKALTGSNNTFAMEMFRDNPLVSVQHDGDLSKIADNTKLNSIVSHEEMVVNERYKHTYTARFRSFLFMGTNTPVLITDAKSGIARRLIDVRPSGRLVPTDRYQVLMAQINFELGQIASRCLDVYLSIGPTGYDGYRPIEMMSATNHFLNFIEDHCDIFKAKEFVTLTEGWNLYKAWAEDADIRYRKTRVEFKEEFKNYFKAFHMRYGTPDGYSRNVYVGFDMSKFEYRPASPPPPRPVQPRLCLDSKVSLLDSVCAECLAQEAKPDGTPARRWDKVTTTLADVDTGKLHYVKLPENHIVIDFDLAGDDGEKSLEKNLKAASHWPDTYAEISRSGNGVHLHYLYEGDASGLARLYSTGIEIKVFRGNASLRRQLTLCNDKPIAVISSGLPLKKGGKVIDFKGLKNERAIRTMIERNLKKAIHPGTKPSVDFIAKILDDAYSSGMHYDVTDMRPSVLSFAANSTHHSLYCIKKVNTMRFASEDASPGSEWKSDTLLFFDVEVFPNLLVVVWKKAGDDLNPVTLINPTPTEIEELVRFKLIGFNNRRYDNHILYARMQGYTNEQIYRLSKQIVTRGSDGRSSGKNCTFREAYGLSYSDIWDFSDNKQSLKKWEIELGISHQELGYSWDDPVPENLWGKVADYCVNDVLATEAVFNHLQPEFRVRQMLAELSGLSVNDTNRQHLTRIIFGKDRSPQSQFVYTDLSEMFPGYTFDNGVSTYRDEIVGEGGYVYAEPNVYTDVALLDIASMHPTSLIELNLFGSVYTKRFSDIKDARIAIKHGDYDAVKGMFDGKFEPYLGDPEDAKALAGALKIVINTVYGLTKATFDCEFRDPRNKDNIVAKRGALFMIDLKHAVQEQGFTVAHIKTDSIKIPNATPEIIRFVMDYGKQYGYIFEHEHTYRKMCLVNQSVYIAQLEDGSWEATGTQFQVPYVFKTLFSKESLEFRDYCITKSVAKADGIYLDFNEDLPKGEHQYRFVGKVGNFVPVLPGRNGGQMVNRFTREDGTFRYVSTADTKDRRWKEAEVLGDLDWRDQIDMGYYEEKIEDARAAITEFMDYKDFVSEQ